MITVDKEFEALISPLSTDEYTQLEENCVKEGIRDPLIVWPQDDGTDILIDGHNRWNIAAKHGGMPFQILRKQFADRDEAKVWILKNQLGRRNIDKWLKFDMSKQLEELEKKNAKNRQGTRTDLHIVPTLAESRGKTRDKMASTIGVSHGTYDKMKAIDEKGTPELKRQVRSGEKSINQGYNEIRNKEIKRLPTLKEYEGQAQERHEDFKNQTLITMADIQQDKKDKATIEDKAIRATKRTLSAVNELFLLMDSEIPADTLTDDGKCIMLGTINQMRTVLSQIEAKMRG